MLKIELPLGGASAERFLLSCWRATPLVRKRTAIDGKVTEFGII
jgi:hypothetical protein